LRVAVVLWLGYAAWGCGDDDEMRQDAGPSHDSGTGGTEPSNPASGQDAGSGRDLASGGPPLEVCSGETTPHVRKIIAQCVPAAAGTYQCSCDDRACGGPFGPPIVPDPDQDAGVIGPWKTRVGENVEEDDAGSTVVLSNEGCRRQFAAASCEDALWMECGVHTGQNE
jgi:hypothetical protein